MCASILIARNAWGIEGLTSFPETIVKLSGDIARHSAFGALNLNSLQFHCIYITYKKDLHNQQNVKSFAQLLLASCCCALLNRSLLVAMLIADPLHIGFLYKNAVLL